MVSIFEYKQYSNCKNSLRSESQRYKNLVFKICNYVPIEYNVFANFVSINNDSANALIQIYNRSSESLYPFRIDIIYSTDNSGRDFTISGDTLIVASLFNMLCYYQLTETVTWTVFLPHNDSTKQTNEMRTDHDCLAILTISNMHNSITKKVMITRYTFHLNLKTGFYY